jgi:hypothetical protein
VDDLAVAAGGLEAVALVALEDDEVGEAATARPTTPAPTTVRPVSGMNDHIGAPGRFPGAAG